MKIAIGADRRGFEYKEKLVRYLKRKDYEVQDVGTYECIPCDYPIYAEAVGKLVASGECDFGVLICATGTGIAIAANKVKGIRCSIGYADEVARKMREHNDANVIAFGSDYMEYEDVERRLEIFLEADFIGEHHIFRINQIKDMEDEKTITQSPIINQDWV